jgi:hypothetical protein
VFVTGDKDLLEIAEQVSGLTITDPRGFGDSELSFSGP